MRRILMVVVRASASLALLVPAAPALASGVVHVQGGGTGTFGADLDGDGEIDGSSFGFGVVLGGGGAVRGHFECLMAGRSDIMELHLMAAEGRIQSGSLNPDGTATFSGAGTVNLADGQRFTDVPFIVTVITEGGPGLGSFTLTVVGAFDGVPGDTLTGNGNYDLPPEVVESGRIRIE